MALSSEQGECGGIAKMSTLFLASICQTKEHIENLEAFFSQSLYPALVKESEVAVEGLRSDYEEEERKWIQEKESLVRDRQAAEQVWLQEKQALAQGFANAEKLWVQEKEGLIRKHEFAELSWTQEKERLELDKQDALAKMEQEKKNLEAKLRSMTRKQTELERDIEGKRQILRSLSSRYSNLKIEHESLIRQQAYKKIEERKSVAEAGVLASKSSGNEEKSEAPSATEDKKTGQEELFKESPGVPVAFREEKRKGTSKEFFSPRANSGYEKWKTTRTVNLARDPHDDFLSTPQELAIQRIAAENGKRNLKEDEQDQAAPNVAVDPWVAAEKNINSGNEWAAVSISAKRPRSASTGQILKYKFNEPVRKKADREALEATDCKQCRRFYEAVRAGNAPGVMNISCQEHHKEVSRHRYRYVPPATPEGFWNIDFDSETQST